MEKQYLTIEELFKETLSIEEINRIQDDELKEIRQRHWNYRHKIFLDEHRISDQELCRLIEVDYRKEKKELNEYCFNKILKVTEERTITKIKDLYMIKQEKIKYFHASEVETYTNLMLFYRGQSDYSWVLEPSIKREKNLIEWEQLKEYNFESGNLFEYIAKCQHYGKKTRFLDFTIDINIALFFACKENMDKDGSLYICPYIPRKASWCDTIIISELSLLKSEITVAKFSHYLYKKYEIISSQYEDIMDISKHIVAWLDHGFIVMPDTNEYEIMKEYNKRIYNQKGTFFICGNKTNNPLDAWHRIDTHAGNNIILPKVCDVPDTMQKSIHVTKIKIPSSLKIEILKYLDKKGINEKYLLDR